MYKDISINEKQRSLLSNLINIPLLFLHSFFPHLSLHVITFVIQGCLTNRSRSIIRIYSRVARREGGERVTSQKFIVEVGFHPCELLHLSESQTVFIVLESMVEQIAREEIRKTGMHVGQSIIRKILRLDRRYSIRMMDVERIAMFAGVGFAIAVGLFVLWGPSPKPRKKGNVRILTPRFHPVKLSVKLETFLCLALYFLVVFSCFPLSVIKLS